MALVVGVVLPMTLSSSLVAGGYWLASLEASSTAKTRVAGWTGVGAAGMALVAAALFGYQLAEGSAVSDPLFVGLNLVVTGAVGGFVVGVYDLRQRERRTQLRRVLDSLRDAVFVHDVDGRFLTANRTALDRWGYDLAELRSMTPQDLDAPEHAADVPERIERIREQGALKFESVHVTADGEHIPVEINAVRIDYRGRPAVLSVARDVSDRQRRIRELRESRQRYRTLVETAPDAIVVADAATGRIVDVNSQAEALTGRSRSDLVGAHQSDLHPPESREAYQDLFADQSDDGTGSVSALSDGSNVEVCTADGDRVPVEINAAKLELDDRTLVQGVFRDVSNRVRRERELERTATELELLNRVVRHDIRNDMTVVLGWLDVVSEHVDEAGRDPLDRALDASEHVVELTENARDYVEVVVGEAEPSLEPVPLDQVLCEEVRTQRESHPAATFDVAEVPAVSVRATEMLDSVFRNLLHNAVDHNDSPDPTVTVDVETTDDAVRVRVADDGPGVPDDRKERIFGKGERGLDSDGTGVGLYLVHSLVDACGGEVWVEDDDPQGAAFVVELQRA